MSYRLTVLLFVAMDSWQSYTRRENGRSSKGEMWPKTILPFPVKHSTSILVSGSWIFRSVRLPRTSYIDPGFSRISRRI